jgi:hypothetical protein
MCSYSCRIVNVGHLVLFSKLKVRDLPAGLFRKPETVAATDIAMNIAGLTEEI